MKKLFENIKFYISGDPEGSRCPFIFTIKDRESKDERWVLSEMTNEELAILGAAINHYYESED